MTTSYLVLFDADRIHDYVFATGRLKEIRGASEQVRALTEPGPIRERSSLDDWSAAAGEGLIYAGGAAGALQFRDRDRAIAFCRDLERAYCQATRGAASITAVCELVADDTVTAQASAQARAARALARRKAARPQSLPPGAGGALRFCASDRLMPASVYAPDPNRANAQFFSEPTACKRLLSFDYRKHLPGTPFWCAFEAALGAKPARTGAVIDTWRAACRADQDLGAIGMLAEARGYVALVHLDGDGMGRALRDVVATYGFAGFQHFSRALADAAAEATGQALASAYADHSLPKVPDTDTDALVHCLPFEVITIGGDDVILICTGEQSLIVAEDLARRFGALVKDKFGPFDPTGLLNQRPPSASAGVVIAHDSLPIVLLARRGHELLKLAKDRQRPVGVGALDFHVVTTPSLDAIQQVRGREYTAGVNTALTCRPYTLDNARTLLDSARRLLKPPMDLPNSKRADLYEACQGDRVLATLNVLAVHARLGQQARAALLGALAQLGGIACYPFADRDDRGVYRTALLDLLEVIEFVPEEAP